VDPTGCDDLVASGRPSGRYRPPYLEKNVDKNAAAKPVLNKVWWDKNKAKTLTSTGVGKSLAAYELALDKALKGSKPAEDEKPVQKAIMDAATTMKAARGKANAKLHAETILALTNMEKLLVEEKSKSIKRAQATPPAPKQDDSGKPDTLYIIKVADKVREQYNPAWLTKLEGWEIKLTLNPSVSRALIADKAGAMRAQEMQVAAKAIGDAAVTAIVNYVKKMDTATATAPADKVDQVRLMLAPFIDKEVAKAQQEMAQVPKKIWAQYTAIQKQYKDYKVDAAVTVTKGVATVAVSAAGLVGSHGASAALSIVGIVRGSADVLTTLYNLALAADTVGKKLMADVGTLQKDYYDADGKVRAARQDITEITGTVLKSILGTDCPFLVTLPKVTADYELWENKVAGVVVEGSSLTGDVTKALDDIDKLEKKLKNADGFTAKKVYNDLLKMRSALDDVLKKTTKLMEQAQTFRTAGPTVKKTIDQLNDNNSNLAKVVDAVLPQLVNLGLSVGGATLDFKAAESALDTVKTAITFANDIKDIGEKTLEAAIGK
jgi:hypothetical protein